MDHEKPQLATPQRLVFAVRFCQFSAGLVLGYQAGSRGGDDVASLAARAARARQAVAEARDYHAAAVGSWLARATGDVR